MKNSPLVEVIVLTHNNKKILENCLKSLEKTNYSNKIITVVNQNSDDGTQELLRKYKKINAVNKKINESFSVANNRILKKSKAKYCILLNDDTEQDSEWISEMVKIAEKDNKIATIQPKVLSLRDKTKFEYAGACGGYLDVYGYTLCRGRIFDKIEKDIGQYEDAREVFWTCGVALFIKKEIFKEVGFLDEDFGSYFEEIDLSWRINLVGYKQIIAPKSIIYHLGSISWGKKNNLKKKEYLLHRNSWMILIKNYSLKSLIKILPIKLILEIITFWVFLLKNPNKSLAVIKSIFWVSLHPILLLNKNRQNKIIKKKTDKEISKKMIKTSIALQYFLSKKNKFPEYIKYLEKY